MQNKKLKIIIFDGSFKTTTFINRLAKGLAQKHQVSILGFNNAIKNKIPNVTYVDLGSSQHLINLLWQSKWLALKKLLITGNFSSFFKTIINILSVNKKQLQQDNFNTALLLIKPDIVHIQWQSLLPWCEEALEKQEFKFIISQRGYQSNVRPFVDQENFNYLQKWYPKFSGFHSVSKAISQVGDKIYSSKKKIDKVVYSGFDFSNFKYIENYHKQDPVQLLSVGRPHWVKGYPEALLACKTLKEKNIPFCYKIIGATVRNEEILYLINDLKLQEQVTLLPKIPQEEVYVKMSQASVLLFPSVIEGLPNVVVEAMAIGLPVISTQCGGVAELIRHDKTGWLVPVNNSEAMAQSIIDFSNLSLSKIEEIRQQARLKVEQQHQEQQMVKDMEDLYFSVLK